LGERRLCTAEVAGSTPVSSTWTFGRHERRRLVVGGRQRERQV
jgi:hypothetical protein